MKSAILILVALTTAADSLHSDQSSAQQQRVVFTRDTNVWIVNVDGTGSRMLVPGADPCISPDGSKLAFTMEPPGINTLRRYIAVMEISTGGTKAYKNLPSDNSFGPVWSPDGSQILFETFVDNHWRVAAISADGSGFQFLKLPPRDAGWFSLCWAPDGKSIFCQDLQTICRFGLEGELIASWPIAKIFPEADLDSSEHLSVSRDGGKLIMDVGMENGESMKNFNGPPPAIWLFEMESGKTKRLTPKGSYAYSPCWLNDTEYLFVDVDKKETSIYRAPVAGGPRKLVVRNGTEQSVSW